MKTIVLLSLEAWDDVWRRNQHLVHRLLRDDPDLQVLFVEPAADPLHALRSGRAPRTGHRIRTVPGYDGRLRTLQPTKWLPRAVDPRADDRLAAGMARALATSGWTPSLYWINDPNWHALAGGAVPTLYDITDDWTLAGDEAGRRSRIVAADDHLVRSCDVVVVCSRELERTKGVSRHVELIPNAVDVDAYRTQPARPADLPDRAAVYAGTLHEHRLDVDLVLASADAAEAAGGTVVLVGPDALPKASSQALRMHPAVSLLGVRPAHELPAYLVHAHALLVPHVVTAFTDTLDPIKLYEYLASGRPIVSTPVAGFRDRPQPIIELASGPDFSDAVAARLAERRPTVETPGIPDWNARAAAMRTAIGRLIH